MPVFELPVVLLSSAPPTSGRVVEAGGVAEERAITDGCIVGAFGIAKKSERTASRVDWTRGIT